MISGSAFQELGVVIDELETKEMTVLDVTATRESLVTDGRLSVELTVGLNSLTGFGEVDNVRIHPADSAAEDDQVTTTFTVEIPVAEDDPGATATELSTRDDQSELDEADVSVDSDAGSALEAAEDETDIQNVTQVSSGTDEVPYYKKKDLLARVYEEHETFAEMTEALDVDVTPATVREHMVNHGIHPSSSDSGAADNSEGDDTPEVDPAEDERGSVTIEADGYGLPENVSMESLVHAVHRSRTLYEVQRELGLERSTVRGILCDLDLLDMVTSRLSDEGTTDIDEIVDRIHSAGTA